MGRGPPAAPSTWSYSPTRLLVAPVCRGRGTSLFRRVGTGGRRGREVRPPPRSFTSLVHDPEGRGGPPRTGLISHWWGSRVDCRDGPVHTTGDPVGGSLGSGDGHPRSPEQDRVDGSGVVRGFYTRPRVGRCFGPQSDEERILPVKRRNASPVRGPERGSGGARPCVNGRTDN